METALNANNPKARTREEMIATLVNTNDSHLRGLLTLTPEVIDGLNAMAEHERIRYGALTDSELEAACRAE